MRQYRKLELTAVFWDLPKFLDENYLRLFLSEQKGKPPYDWAMARFLIYGRIIDALSVFTIKEISENLDKLQIPAHSLKIWKRMVEVFENAEGVNNPLSKGHRFHF